MAIMKKPRFTETQGRYLAFLHACTVVHRHAPSEAEMPIAELSYRCPPR